MVRTIEFLLGLCLVGLGIYRGITVEIDVYAIMLVVFGIGLMARWFGSSSRDEDDGWFDSDSGSSSSGSSCSSDD
ncbi:hypothetical protein ACJJI4_06235 [Microbulbifer sp. TRSA002]|uniref:hypothetical protein n=1 Tax=Microbulbifer sp. TRSA002 TaxID=3243382 RepID=UPI0040395E59